MGAVRVPCLTGGIKSSLLSPISFPSTVFTKPAFMKVQAALPSLQPASQQDQKEHTSVLWRPLQTQKSAHRQTAQQGGGLDTRDGLDQGIRLTAHLHPQMVWEGTAMTGSGCEPSFVHRTLVRSELRPQQMKLPGAVNPASILGEPGSS